MISLDAESLAVLGGLGGIIFLIMRGNVWKNKAKKSQNIASKAKAQSKAYEYSNKEEKATQEAIDESEMQIKRLDSIGDIFKRHADKVRQANTKYKDRDPE